MKEATIKVPHFLASRLKMPSAEMTGIILEENEQAVHFEGVPAFRTSNKCLRCGREISQPEYGSGYGPECRSLVQGASKMRLWLPRSKVEVFGPGQAPPGEAPAPATVQRDVKVPTAPVSAGPVRLWVDSKHIFAQTPFSYSEYCKEVPSYSWDKNKKAWKYTASPSVAEKLMATMLVAGQNFKTNTVPETDEAFDNLVRQNIAITSAQVLKTSDDLPPIPCTKHQPWLHQARAFWFVAELWGGLPDAKDN